VATFDSNQFRHVLGHFPTGVTVVTGISPSTGEPGGLTIGSFTSVSLDPPLVGFLPGKASKSWPQIADAGSFCVNVLGVDQGEICWRFAKELEGRFDGIAWTPAPSGSPILPGVIAWVDCAVEHIYEMGDHWFVLGRAEHVYNESDVLDGLVFFRGKVGGVRQFDPAS